ncbi:MAG: hypothetical protein Q8P46_07645 [Hyphomicrobiales bacterium]|nr:hypothetical protein [Hyphomicrobiales bacterium]
MADVPEPKMFAAHHKNLPPNFPTHRHSAEFWEALGRTVATFGFLEQMLGKAVFSFTATRRIPDDEIEAEYERWLPTLKRALSDPLGGLIKSYCKAVRANSNATITEADLDDLLNDLRKVSTYRNVLCHGSWSIPDAQGRSIPFFVDKNIRKFDTPIDVAFLQRLQGHVAELTCDVINTVTHMGWQFPGSGGPGTPIFQSQHGNAREG